MPIGKGEGDRERDMAGEAYIRKLRKTFEEMPHDIPLLLFADRGADNVFAQAARQVIRAFRELSPRITLKEYDLTHELARKHQVTSSPDASHRPGPLLPSAGWARRWARRRAPFWRLCSWSGAGKSSLSEQSAKVIRRIDSAAPGQGVREPHLSRTARSRRSTGSRPPSNCPTHIAGDRRHPGGA